MAQNFPEDYEEDIGEQQAPSLRDLNDVYDRHLSQYNKTKGEDKASGGKGAEGGKDAQRAGGKGAKDAGAKGAEKEAGKAAGKTAGKEAGEKAAAKAAERRAALAAGGKLLAKGASVVGLLTAIPDLIRLLKTKFGKIALGTFFCCSPIMFFVLPAAIGVAFFMSSVGGESQESMHEVLCPFQISSCLTKDFDKVFRGGCYRRAILQAEKTTDVPWQILGAIDFKQYALGGTDDRGLTDYEALTEIGLKVQEANLQRNIDGELIWSNGKPLKTVSVSNNYTNQPLYNLLYAAPIIELYKCRYVEGKPAKECWKCHDKYSQILTDPWMISNSRLMPIPSFQEGNHDNTGAFVFYNVLMKNCTNCGVNTDTSGDTELASLINPPGSPSAPGNPGSAAALALAQVGKAYEWNGPSCRDDLTTCPPDNAPNSFDCSGLVAWVIHYASGGAIDASGSSQTQYGRFPHIDQAAAQPGDLVFFNGASHVGICVTAGCTSVVHAADENLGVIQSNLSDLSTALGLTGFAHPQP